MTIQTMRAGAVAGLKYDDARLGAAGVHAVDGISMNVSVGYYVGNVLVYDEKEITLTDGTYTVELSADGSARVGTTSDHDFDIIRNSIIQMSFAAAQMDFRIGGTTEEILTAAARYPNADNGLDLGTTTKSYFNGYIDRLNVGGVTGAGAGDVLLSGKLGVRIAGPNSPCHIIIDDSVPAQGGTAPMVVGIGASNGDMELRIGVSDTNNYTWLQSVERATGNRALILNKEGGNVGIGVDPTHVFDINTDNSLNTMRIKSSTHLDINIDSPDGTEKTINFEEAGTLRWKLGMDNAPNADAFIIAQLNNPASPEFTILPDGSVGLNEPAPDERLEVNGNVHITGDTYWTGDGSGVYYGFVYGDNLNYQQSLVQNTWYQVTEAGATGNMTPGPLNNITESAGTLTVLAAGHYKVNYAFSAELSTANKHVEHGISVNSGAPASPLHFHLPTVNAEDNVAGCVILDLNANDTIDIAVMTPDAVGGGLTLTVDHTHLVVDMKGGT